jgi:hypothetical protein
VECSCARLGRSRDLHLLPRDQQESSGHPTPQNPVTAGAYQVPSGEAECDAHDGLALGIQLGPSPVDLALHCDALPFQGRFLPGDLTSIPPGEKHGLRTRASTNLGHLFIHPDFIARACDGRLIGQLLDCRFRFQDPLVSEVMKGGHTGTRSTVPGVRCRADTATVGASDKPISRSLRTTSSSGNRIYTRQPRQGAFTT